MFTKILGYGLGGVGGAVLGLSGIGCTTWQFWVILLCFMLGIQLVNWE